uniref:Uncharacterized protein n=1 Tax=Cacopsylla melanoneura TaxID=428564 RepID=A0A8D8T9D5_9HEMI
MDQLESSNPVDRILVHNILFIIHFSPSLPLSLSFFSLLFPTYPQIFPLFLRFFLTFSLFSSAFPFTPIFFPLFLLISLFSSLFPSFSSTFPSRFTLFSFLYFSCYPFIHHSDYSAGKEVSLGDYFHHIFFEDKFKTNKLGYRVVGTKSLGRITILWL